MNPKKLILVMALCLIAVAIPAFAEVYTCEEQGFTFEYDPAYAVVWQDGNGAVVYTEKSGYIPYVMAWCNGKGDTSDYSVDDFFARYTKSIREKYGARLMSVEEGMAIEVRGESVPGMRYIYDVDGSAVELVVFLHKTNDFVRQFTAKYIRDSYESADKTIDTLLQVVRSFKLIGDADEKPVNTPSSGVYNCEQQSFSFEYDPMYTARWEEETGVVIYTQEEGYIPYAIVSRIGRGAMPNLDVDAYLKRYTKGMQDTYADRLISIEEGLTLTLDGISFPGARYVYELDGVKINGSAVKVELMVFVQKTEDSVRRYVVKYNQGEGDAPVSAMAQAIRSFTAKEIPASYDTYIFDEANFSIEFDSAYGVADVDGEYARIYTETFGSVPYATIWAPKMGDISGYDVDELLSEHTQIMRRDYGDKLRTVEETSIMLNGEKLKGMSYIYDNNQGYGIERVVFYHKTLDSLRQYEVRCFEGMLDDTLAAMIHAAESLKLLRTPAQDIIITAPTNKPTTDIIITGPTSKPTTDISITAPTGTPTIDDNPEPIQPASSSYETHAYSRIDIVTADGMKVGRSYLPDGYSVSTAASFYPLDYGVSLASPVQVALSAVSPDGNTVFQYTSKQTYVHLPYGEKLGLFTIPHTDGELSDSLQTMMLHEMSAAEYNDFLMDNILLGAQLIDEIPITERERQMIDSLNNFESTDPVLMAVLQEVRASVSTRVYRGYENGKPLVVFIKSGVVAEQYCFGENLWVLWSIPATYICATAEENADSARKDFEMFCSNTIQSLEFQAAMVELTNNFASIITNSRRESFNAYFTDKTGGTPSYDFSDAILSQDSYELSSGEYVTVPNSLPYAYADDNGNVVATNSALYEPAGMTRLYGK